MINQAKRDTIKKLSAGAMVPLVSTSVSASAFAHSSDASRVMADKIFPTGISELLIDVISSAATQQHTVILTNLTDATMPVRHFSPGTIYWNNESGQRHTLDLNALRSDVGILLQPHRAVSLSTRAQPSLNSSSANNQKNTGIWSDDAISRLDENTLKIRLGAYHYQHQLVVYPIPQVQLFA